jgi:hypothetical protein
MLVRSVVLDEITIRFVTVDALLDKLRESHFFDKHCLEFGRDCRCLGEFIRTRIYIRDDGRNFWEASIFIEENNGGGSPTLHVMSRQKTTRCNHGNTVEIECHCSFTLSGECKRLNIGGCKAGDE